MDNKEKIDLIQNYKNVAIASLDKVLDSLNSLQNQYSSELIKQAGFTINDKDEKILSDYTKSIPIYEAVKHKILSNSEITTYEINLTAISMLFASTLMKAQGENMIKSSTKISEIANSLMT